MRLAEVEEIVMYVSIGIFAILVFFIIYDLAKKSKSGKFGTVILFLTLGLGLFGFVIKSIIVSILDK